MILLVAVDDAVPLADLARRTDHPDPQADHPRAGCARDDHERGVPARRPGLRHAHRADACRASCSTTRRSNSRRRATTPTCGAWSRSGTRTSSTATCATWSSASSVPTPTTSVRPALPEDATAPLPRISAADAAQAMIDLHTHSTASDGTDTPAELVARRRRRRCRRPRDHRPRHDRGLGRGAGRAPARA